MEKVIKVYNLGLYTLSSENVEKVKKKKKKVNSKEKYKNEEL